MTHFIKFDRDIQIWKVLCYYKDKKFGINIIHQLNDKGKILLFPELLDEALIELVKRIMRV